MEPDEFYTETKEIEGFETAGKNPVPRPERFGGSLATDAAPQVDQKDHGPTMMEFDIKTNALDALNALKAKTQLASAAEDEDEGGIHEDHYTPVAHNEEGLQFDYFQTPTDQFAGGLGAVYPGSGHNTFESNLFMESGQQASGLQVPKEIDNDLFDSADHSQVFQEQPLQQSLPGYLPEGDAEDYDRERRLQEREAERMRSLYQATVAVADADARVRGEEQASGRRARLQG